MIRPGLLPIWLSLSIICKSPTIITMDLPLLAILLSIKSSRFSATTSSSTFKCPSLNL
jgi:hypothetical protein